MLVQPETIPRWHRAGFRAFWRRRSRASGRPRPARAALIREMSVANPRWGAERIRGELLELGIHVSNGTVQKYMCRPRGRGAAHGRVAEMLRDVMMVRPQNDRESFHWSRRRACSYEGARSDSFDRAHVLGPLMAKLPTMIGRGFTAPPFSGLVLGLEAPGSPR